VSELFDCVETLNGSDGEAENRAAAAFDILTPLPGIAGRTATPPAEAGRWRRVLPVAVRDGRGDGAAAGAASWNGAGAVPSEPFGGSD
jgi:hypothetical protein